MTVFFRELKANRKALIIWSICMFLLIASGMGKYTAYAAGGANEQVFKQLPYSVKALLGIGSFDVTTISGYFAMLFLYIELTAAIHAVMLGSHILAKEERDKTTEFLYAKPVSRTVVITSKLLAALVNIIILNIVSLISSIIMVDAYNKGASISEEILVFMLSMFIVQLIFLSLGTASAALIRNPKSSSSIAVGIMVASFVISEITSLTDRLNFLNVFSPFKYFDYSKILDGYGLHFTIVVLSLLVVVAFSFTTYTFYRKRDLNV